MDSELLLRFDPPELVFPFESDKRLSSYIRLSNISRNHVAFKMKSTNPSKYGVRPRIGILSPGSTCEVTVTTRAPNSTKCKDKFMIQSVVVSSNATVEDAQEIFERISTNVFHEYKLRVFFRDPAKISSLMLPMSETLNSNVSEATTSEPSDSASQHDKQTHATTLLKIDPSEIQFSLKLNKELSSSLHLSNITENPVAFMVNTSSSRHSVEPCTGLITPQSTTAITVKMRLKLDFPSGLQNDDKLLIRSIVTDASATTDDISLDMFDKAGSSVQELEVRMNYTRILEPILRGVVFVLMSMVSWYLMRQAISFIGSLVMMVVMLMIKMVKRMVSDSVEDWIVKTMLYIFMHILFGRKANPDIRKD